MISKNPYLEKILDMILPDSSFSAAIEAVSVKAPADITADDIQLIVDSLAPLTEFLGMDAASMTATVTAAVEEAKKIVLAREQAAAEQAKNTELIAYLKELITQKEAAIRQLSNTVADQSSRIDSLSEQLEAERRNSNEYRLARDAAERELADLQGSAEECAAERTRLSTENAELREANASLTNVNAEIQTALDNTVAAKAEIETQLAAAQEHAQALATDLADTSAAKDAAEQQVAELSAELSHMKDADTQQLEVMTKLQNELAAAKETVAAQTARIDKLTAELSTAELTVNELASAKDQLDAQITELTAARDELAAQLQVATTTIAAQKSALRTKDTELAELREYKATHQSSDSLLAKLRKDNADLMAKVAMLEAQLKRPRPITTDAAHEKAQNIRIGMLEKQLDRLLRRLRPHMPCASDADREAIVADVEANGLTDPDHEAAQDHRLDAIAESMPHFPDFYSTSVGNFPIDEAGFRAFEQAMTNKMKKEG